MKVIKLIDSVLIFAVIGLASSCSNDPAPFNCELTDLTIALSSNTNATNCITPDGSILVMANAGKEPYTFFLNDQTNGQPTGEFTALAAGIYTVSVQDGNGCIKSENNITIAAQNFSFLTTILEDNACLGGNGSVIIDVAIGNPPYSYNISDGLFTENNSFSGLTSGNHSIGVKDVDGCTVTLTITIPKGKSNTSWSNSILPIVETTCSKSKCHDGISHPDLRLYPTAKKFALQMKSETKSKNMPREGSLTQSQIDLIGCWVDDGALDN